MLASGLVQLHPPVGWVDPNLYVYWFMTPAENLKFRGPEYHGGRLPFVIPGVLLYRLFDPGTAQAVLTGGFYILGVLVLAGLSAAALRGPAARLAFSLGLGLTPLWIAAFARGYVDGPAIAMTLGAIGTSLARPTRHGLLGAGLLLALAGAAHPLAGGIGAAALAGGALARASHWRDPPRETAWLGLGVGIGLLALGLAGASLGFPFAFLGMSGSALRAAVGGAGQSFTLPPVTWVPAAQRLVLVPVLALLLAGAARCRGDRLGAAIFGAALGSLAALLIAGAGFQVFLQFPYYASYWFIPLSLCALLTLRLAEQHGVTPHAGTALAVVALAGGALAVGAALPLAWRDAGTFFNLSWAAVLAGTIAAGLALVMRPGAVAVPALGVIALAGAVNRDTASVFHLADAPDSAAAHRALGQVRARLSAGGYDRGAYLLWLDRDGYSRARNVPPSATHAVTYAGRTTRYNLLDSIGASLGWDRVALGFGMPRLADGAADLLARAPDPAILITLCAEASVCQSGAESLGEVGYSTRVVASHAIDEPGIPRFTLTMMRLAAASQDVPPDGTVAGALTALLLDGPGGAIVRAQAIRVSKATGTICEGPPWAALCAFDYELTNGERHAMALPFARRAGAWTPALHADPEAGRHPQPSRELIARSFEELLRNAKTDGGQVIKVVRVFGVDCDSAGSGAICRFGLQLTNGERTIAELAFRRTGGVWRRGMPLGPDVSAPAPTPQPTEADVARVVGLIAPPGEKPVPVTGLVCEGSPAAALCDFDLHHDTGSSEARRLILIRPGRAWTIAPPGTPEPSQSPQPDRETVRRALQRLLLDGPNGAAVRAEGISAKEIDELTCEGEPVSKVCRFTFVLSNGERARADLTFVREGVLWRRPL